MNSRTTSALAAACALAAGALILSGPALAHDDGSDHPHAYGESGAPYETSGGSGSSGGSGGDYHASSSGSGGGTSYGGSTSNSNGYTSDGGSDGVLAHGSGASHQALLIGGNEVSPEGKADAGDPDGNGAASISIDPEAGKLCFAIVVNNLDNPVAAHIHQGRAGTNGPVVVALKAPEKGDPGTSSGCVDNVDRVLLQAIHAHPWAYYVNVHSSAYPDGAARGQLQ